MARVEVDWQRSEQARGGLRGAFVRGWLYAALGIVLAITLAPAPRGHTQSGNGTGTGQNTIRPPYAPRTDLGTLSSDDYDPMMSQRRLRMLNTERQKELVTDTNTLL